MGELAVAGIFVVLGLVGLITSLSLSYRSGYALGPGFFPLCVSLGMLGYFSL